MGKYRFIQYLIFQNDVEIILTIRYMNEIWKGNKSRRSHPEQSRVFGSRSPCNRMFFFQNRIWEKLMTLHVAVSAVGWWSPILYQKNAINGRRNHGDTLLKKTGNDVQCLIPAFCNWLRIFIINFQRMLHYMHSERYVGPIFFNEIIIHDNEKWQRRICSFYLVIS